MSDATYQAIAAWSQVAGSILWIAVLVYVFVRFAVPAVLASQEKKNAELAEAESRRDAARREIAEAKADIASAQTDAAATAVRAQRDAAAIHDHIVADARAEAERVMRNAGSELERGRAAASDQLRTELLATALRIARGDAASLDAATDKRLVQETVETADRGAHT